MSKLSKLLSVQTIHQGSKEAQPIIDRVREWLEEAPDDPSLHIALALDAAMTAVENGGESVEEVLKVIGEALPKAPNHPLLLSLKALMPALAANSSWNPVNKYAQAKKAMKGLDDVVERFPDFYASHAMRGQAFAMMPDLVLDTRDTALADLRWICDAWKNRSIYVNLKTYIDSLIFLARHHAHEGDHAKLLEILSELSPLVRDTKEEGIVNDLEHKHLTQPLIETAIKPPTIELPESLRMAEKRLRERLEKAPEELSVLKRLGMIEYFAGLTGDRKAINDSVERLTRAYEHDCEDPVTLTMLGCAWVLSGGSSHYSAESFARVAIGLRFLCEADALDSDNYILHWLRTSTYLGIPSDLFLTQKRCAESYRYLVTADPDLASLQRDLQAIFEDENWIVDAYQYYISTILHGYRFHSESRVPFLTSQTVAMLANPAQRLEIVKLLIEIVKTFPNEIPPNLESY